MSFAVLQSVYKNDVPEYLRESLFSIEEQTLKPDLIVIVMDGKLPDELLTVIEDFKNKLPLKVVGYDENKGLAYALNYGLQFINTEYVVRMDSDDIAIPKRFEIQIDFMEKHPDIVLSSGYINEFKNDCKIIESVRKVPLENNEIIEFLKKRNAFNHMAVCFKKSAVIEAGGYQIVPYFEDYDLWVRIVQKGFKVANIPEVLVNARIGNDMIGRRHGFAYSKHELFFLKRQLQRNFISKFEYIKLICLRVPVRLFPKKILSFVYKLVRK